MRFLLWFYWKCLQNLLSGIFFRNFCLDSFRNSFENIPRDIFRILEFSSGIQQGVSSKVHPLKKYLLAFLQRFVLDLSQLFLQVFFFRRSSKKKNTVRVVHSIPEGIWRILGGSSKEARWCLWIFLTETLRNAQLLVKKPSETIMDVISERYWKNFQKYPLISQ